jgi:hypothetical protein
MCRVFFLTPLSLFLPLPHALASLERKKMTWLGFR